MDTTGLDAFLEQLLDILTSPLGILLISAILIGIIIQIIQQVRSKRAWDELATITGLQPTVHRREPVAALTRGLSDIRIEKNLAGRYRDRDAELTQVRTKNAVRVGGEREVQTRRTTTASVRLGIPLPGRFTLQRAIVIGKQKLPDVPDAEMLERNFSIQSDPPELVGAVISLPQLRRRLLAIEGKRFKFHLWAPDGRTWLYYSQDGRVTDARKLKQVLDLLVDMAQAVEMQ